MDIVKAFTTNNMHTEIVIKGTHEEPLFRASDVGEILELTNIRINIQDFNDTEKIIQIMSTLGGQQHVTFLTEKGLYKVLFRSRKPIAEQFQNWVCEVIKEIRFNGSYELEQQLEQANEKINEANQTVLQLEEQNEKDKSLEREQVLLRQYGTIGSIFYIMRIKSLDNGCYIVKVGESRAGVSARYAEHKSKYEECLLLDCVTVNRSKDFETFVKHHPSVAPSKVTDLLGHEREQELFLIGRHLSYRTLLKLVEGNVKQYNDNNQELAALQLRYDILKMESESPNKGIQVNDDILKELVQNNKMLTNMVGDLTKTVEELKHIILSNEKPNQIKTVTGFGEPLVTLGQRLQCINPETLQLVKVYESVTECMSMDSKIKRPSINKAVVENTVYNGFRWLLVDRELDSSVIVHIEPTVMVVEKNTGYIAKMNADKTEIINVYLDRKTASIDNGYSASGLDNAFKNTTIINCHYYVLYDTCSEEMQSDFVLEKNNGSEPLLFKSGVGQYNEAHVLVKEFACKYDCIKGLKMSDKTLEKAITLKLLYCGHYYELVGSRVKCF